jgi:hypothetical protein
VWLPGAALGGLVYGFSPYMIGEGTNHVVFTFAPIPPFIALTIVSILQRKGSPWRLGIQLGLLVVAQYFISQELLADTAVVVFVALVFVALRYPRRIREFARAMGRPLLIALPIVAGLLAYPVWMLADGPQHTSRAAPVVNGFHNDLLTFVVPGPLQHVSLGMRSLGDRLTLGLVPQVTQLLTGSNPIEIDGYIGIAVIALSAFLVWRSRRSPRMQLAAALFLGSAVLSLGPFLVIDGRSTHVSLPFLVLAHIPLVENAFPDRFSLEVSACLAAVIAFGLDDMQRNRPRPKWLTSRVFAAAFIVVLVVTQLPQWPYSLPGQESTLPTALRAAIPPGDPITVTYPYDTETITPPEQPLGWQMDAGYTFRLLGGYARVRGPNGGPTLMPARMSPSALQRFLAAQRYSGVSPYGPPLPFGPELVSITRTTMSKYDIRLVIVDRSEPGSGPVVRLFTDALGPPKVSSGGFSLWADGGHSWISDHDSRGGGSA